MTTGKETTAAKQVTVKFEKAHTHAGKKYKAGETAPMSEHAAAKAVEFGAGKIMNSAEGK